MPEETQEVIEEVVEQQQTTVAAESASTQQASTDSSSNPSVEDVMAEFTSAGLAPTIGETKKPLPPPVTPPAPGTKPAPKPAAKVEEPKEEEKKEEGIEGLFKKMGEISKEPAQPKEAPVVSKGGKPTHRDYAKDLPPELHAVAKEMSNPAYTEFVKYVQENKALKADKTIKSENGLPVSYFEHPDSYILSPEFNQATTVIRQADSVLAHWEAQKRKIAEGEDWQDLDVDDKGQIVLGRVHPASEEAKFKIGQYIQHVSSKKLEAQRYAGEIKQTFAAKTQQTTKWLREQEDIHMPMFKDEKSPLWADANEVYKQLPAELKHSPLASTLAKTVAVNRASIGYNKMLMQKVADLESRLARYEKVERPAGNNGVVKASATSGGKSSVKPGDVPVESVLEEFAEAGFKL
jgi:iron-sulfur cluster repair protein YtfE (RIC family)